MALRDDIKEILQTWKDHTATLEHNANIFNVIEGELLPQVLADLKKQLNDKSYESIKHRVPPINVLIRIIDKLSTIYTKSPIRTLKGSKKNQKAFGELLRAMDFDSAMAEANRFFNAFKSTWIEPYLHEGKPCLRSIPSDRFFVISKDPVDPTRPTHLIKIMGKSEGEVVFWAYTKDEFLIFDSKEKILDGMMNSLGNPNGVNLYGCLPGVYVNRSKHCLIPKIDTDILSMTKLIPVLLADCNFAVMFQAFSIIYGIDLDDKGLVMAPNAFWAFKSDSTNGETKPSVGVIKPELDTDKALELVKTLLAMWLESKGIKPGSVGTMTVENAASGVAKMIDEADTTEDRKKQVTIFAPRDAELCDVIVNHMLPEWKKDPKWEVEDVITGVNLRFTTEFPEQKPIVDEGAATNTQKTQLEAGLTTRRRAIKKLNPDMTDDQVDELIAEIDEERAVREAEMQEQGLDADGNPIETDPDDKGAGKPIKAKKSLKRKSLLNGCEVAARSISVPDHLGPREREAVAAEVLDFIRERTAKNLDKNNKEFAGYSEPYVRSLDFKIAGKSKGDVNLTLSGDMLGALDLLNHKSGRITIGFENGTEENARADGNIRGTYGNSKSVGPKRDFLGITQKDLETILAKYESSQDGGRKRAREVLNFTRDDDDGEL